MSNLQKKREDKRFHGAFTGGFSAGYFNTVGSKEGWTPSTFQSSRGHDVSRKQRIEDFMDEEDDPLLGKRLELSSKYDISAQDAQSKKFQTQQAAENVSIPGFVVDDFIQPSKSTIGTTLLGKMGWKPGQGVGPKVRKRKFSRFDDPDDNTVLIAPKHNINIADFFPAQKNDKYGVGFDPFVNAPEFGFLKRQQEAASKQSNSRTIMTFADAIRGGGGNTMGHGLSALEEADDLDIYAMDTKESFDRVLSKAPTASRAMLTAPHDDEDRPAPTQFCSDGTPVLTGFKLSSTRHKPPPVVLAAINVPPNWTPTLKHLRLAPPRKQRPMTAAQRGEALGEVSKQPAPPAPERQLLHSQFRAGMLAAISNRFQKASSSTDESTAAAPIARAIEPLVRQTRPFMPDKLLCKRFRIAVPDAPAEAPAKPSVNARFENDILAHIPAGAASNEPIVDVSKEELPELPPLERPPIDLFQSVFENDDEEEEDDSSSSSSSSEDEEETKTDKPQGAPKEPSPNQKDNKEEKQDDRERRRSSPDRYRYDRKRSHRVDRDDSGDRDDRSRDKSKKSKKEKKVKKEKKEKKSKKHHKHHKSSRH